MTTILIISVGASSLHAVARDPAVRLRVDVTQVGQPDTRYVVDDQPIVARPETGDLAGALSLVAALAGSRGIAVAAVAHRVGHEATIHLVPEVIDDALIAIVGERPDLSAVPAARALWPDIAQIACYDDDEAVAYRRVLNLLRRPPRRSLTVPARDDDNRVDQMLADPMGYFTRARARARVVVQQDVRAVMRPRRH